MKPLTDMKFKYSCRFFEKWNDPKALSKEEYLKELADSLFVPCPRGMNSETFRFYEALESGCIPLVLKTDENEQWFKWVSDKIPLVALDYWSDASRIMISLLNSPDRLEIYREKILSGWANWVVELKDGVRKWLQA